MEHPASRGGCTGCLFLSSSFLNNTGCLGLSGLNLTEGEGGGGALVGLGGLCGVGEGPLCEEVSGQVFVLEQVLEEAWHVVGYFEEVQLTQLFSTENNLSIYALSQELLVLLLSYSRIPFYIID